MVRAKRPAIYTLPFGADICDATADIVIQSCGGDPMRLTECLILLPNNRAIKAMSESFVRRAAPGLLMPRMAAIGDFALDEALGPVLDSLVEYAPAPALMPPLERQLLLARLVLKQRERLSQKIDAVEALRLARLLAELIDELDIEQITFSDVQALAHDREIVDDPELAGHWQNSYAMLLEILPIYRAKMREFGMEGPAARRNILLSNLENRLRIEQPATPIFASGISTAAPAIAKLLGRIASLKEGRVILPPIDLQMSDEDWTALGPIVAESDDGKKAGRETHPQFHLKLLLERIAINRSEVTCLDILQFQIYSAFRNRRWRGTKFPPTKSKCQIYGTWLRKIVRKRRARLRY